MDSLLAEQIQSCGTHNGSAEASGHLFNLAEFDNILGDPLGTVPLDHQQAVFNPVDMLKRKEPTFQGSMNSERIKQERYRRNPPVAAPGSFNNMANLPAADFNFAALNTGELLGSSLPTFIAQQRNVEQLSTLASNKKTGKRKSSAESEEDKQARIRLRNREQARRCRLKKRQAAEDLGRKVNSLSHENEVLKKAFSVLYTQKALLESVVTAQFGQLGQMIIQSTRGLEPADATHTAQLCRNAATVAALSNVLNNQNGQQNGLENLSALQQLANTDASGLQAAASAMRQVMQAQQAAKVEAPASATETPSTQSSAARLLDGPASKAATPKAAAPQKVML